MVKVKLYSILRELSGVSELEINFDGSLTPRRILEDLSSRYEGLRRALDAIGWQVQVVVDGKPVELDKPLNSEPKTVYILPPSSGGVEEANETAVRAKVAVLKGNDRIDLNEVVSELYGDDPGNGAVAMFVGIVRGVNRGEGVRELRYEHAEELLKAKLQELAEEAIRRFSLSSALVYHYVGPRRPGELTMVVGVSGASRNNVFPALQWLVNAVKHEAPIWKEEIRESGRYFIVGDTEIKA